MKTGSPVSPEGRVVWRASPDDCVRMAAILEKLSHASPDRCLDAIHRYVRHYAGEQRRGKLTCPTAASYEKVVVGTAEIDLNMRLEEKP